MPSTVCQRTLRPASSAEPGRRRLFDYRKVPRRKRALILAAMLFWSVLSYLFVSRFVVVAMEVDGLSMFPTLSNGERLIINRWQTPFRHPQRGDIVAVRVPGLKGLEIKRIVALPGEHIHFGINALYINGVRQREPYVNPFGVWTGNALGNGEYEVAPSCYFILGDNRSLSLDSRCHGAIPENWIVGYVWP